MASTASTVWAAMKTQLCCLRHFQWLKHWKHELALVIQDWQVPQWVGGGGGGGSDEDCMARTLPSSTLPVTETLKTCIGPCDTRLWQVPQWEGVVGGGGSNEDCMARTLLFQHLQWLKYWKRVLALVIQRPWQVGGGGQWWRLYGKNWAVFTFNDQNNHDREVLALLTHDSDSFHTGNSNKNCTARTYLSSNIFDKSNIHYSEVSFISQWIGTVINGYLKRGFVTHSLHPLSPLFFFKCEDSIIACIFIQSMSKQEDSSCEYFTYKELQQKLITDTNKRL